MRNTCEGLIIGFKILRIVSELYILNTHAGSLIASSLMLIDFAVALISLIIYIRFLQIVGNQNAILGTKKHWGNLVKLQTKLMMLSEQQI